MKVNPEKLVWTAPTTNTDGTEITYDLEYEVGLVGETGEITPLLVVASQLQTDGKYSAPIADLGLKVGTYSLVLRTFAKDNPKRVSTWSNPVTFAISEEIPNAPLDLQVY